MRRQTLIYCPVWSVCLLWCEYEGLIYFDLQIVDGSSIRTNKEGIVEDYFRRSRDGKEKVQLAELRRLGNQLDIGNRAQKIIFVICEIISGKDNMGPPEGLSFYLTVLVQVTDPILGTPLSQSHLNLTSSQRPHLQILPSHCGAGG